MNWDLFIGVLLVPLYMIVFSIRSELIRLWSSCDNLWDAHVGLSKQIRLDKYSHSEVPGKPKMFNRGRK